MTEQDSTPEIVTIRLDLELEITDAEALISAAEQQIEADETYEDEAERVEDLEWVREGAESALTYLLDAELVLEDLPGVELVSSVVGPFDEED